jgi:citrate lyase subunit beta-like protein
MKRYVPRRAILYVPGNDIRKIRKIPSVKPDSVVLDMEDGVAITRKAEARKTIQSVLDNVEVPFGSTECCVRVNSVQSGLCEDDMAMVCSLKNLPPTLMLPKVDNAEQLRWFAFTLRTRLANRKLTDKLGLIMFIESAAGVMKLRHLVEEGVRLSHNSPFTVEGLVFGSDDLCADIGATRSKEADEVLYARQQVLLVAKSFGLQAIDIVYIDYKDEQGLKRQAEQGCRWGFTGKQVIHPSQVPIVQQAFSPSPESVKYSRGLIQAFEESQKTGKGAFVYEDKMIDRPLLLQAKNIVQLADAVGLPEENSK